MHLKELYLSLNSNKIVSVNLFAQCFSNGECTVFMLNPLSENQPRWKLDIFSCAAPLSTGADVPRHGALCNIYGSVC